MKISKLKQLLKHKKKVNEEQIDRKFVFSSTIDKTLKNIGYIARKNLEKIEPEKRQKIVYFISYHHSKFAALLDAIHILALQLRNAEVYTVSSAYFYQKEDVIYGGVYNENRFELQYNLHQNENILLSEILQTKVVSLDLFLNKSDIEFAIKFSQNADPTNWKELKFEGLDIGEMAYYIVANMNNQPYMLFNETQIREFRYHLVNCIKLHTASKRLLEYSKPDSIISNVPFYYQWKIPFLNALKLDIPAYSYMLSERKNTIFWSDNTTSFFDSKKCWDTYKNSNIIKEYNHLIEQGIKDRLEGTISNHKFAPNANKKNDKLEQIINKIKGKPTILLPCNVLVDASVLAPTKSFSSCLEMIEDIIDWFKLHPQFCCILKAHPAEKLWTESGTNISQMHLSSMLKQKGIIFPDNVIFIEYNEDISVYSLFDFINGIVAYSSSVCMDAGFFGKQSISVAKSHYKIADFVMFPSNKTEFYSMIEGILNNDEDFVKPPNEIKELAQKYYLLYYYIGQIDYKLLQGNDVGSHPLRIFFDSEEKLFPGNNKALDYICNAILNKQPIFGENKWPPITI